MKTKVGIKAGQSKLVFNKPALAKTVNLLRAIHHPQRQVLLKTIDKKPGISVMELKAKKLVDPLVVSQHLAILRNAGLVSSYKEGRIVYYTLTEKVLIEVLEWIENNVTL